MEAIHIGNRRELFWDDFLIDQSEGVTIRMNKPEYRGTAMVCDKPWEGNTCGYCMTFRDGNIYRLYYRAANLQFDADGNVLPNAGGKICYAESLDGKTFYKPNLGLCEFGGTKENNIILNDRDYDNFSIFRDDNPDCPPDEKYKGLTGEFEPFEDHYIYSLTYYKSADGIRFERAEVIIREGAFDSLNLAFWDENRKEYMLYFRDLHDYTGNNKWTGIRDIRLCTSKDFRNWSEPCRIEYGEDKPDFHMYTNGIRPYARANHVYVGLPSRYNDRVDDIGNYKHLPDRRNRAVITKTWGRCGTAMTDGLVMFSRDGLHFKRSDEAFITPGIERQHNWYYGDCYMSWGLLETAADRKGAPNELSFFSGDHYRMQPIEFMRYAIRLDGFFSWQSDYKEGRVMTKPLIFEGGSLSVNFATSAVGYVKITLCENGKPIEGFTSGRLFGNSIDRPVDFAGNLADLAGKPITMLFEMCDAELFSMKFSDALMF